MRILLCTNDFPPDVGGIQTYSYEVAGGLSSWGEKVTVLAPQAERDLQFDRRQSFQVVRAGNKIELYLKFFWLLRRRAIEKILVAHRADYAALASWANTFWGIDYYVVAHGGEIFLPGSEESIRKNFSRAKKIIAVSKFTGERLIRLGIPERKVTIIPNGVNPQSFRMGLDVSPVKDRYRLKGKKVILTVSRLVKRKGVDNVIRALPRVVEKVPEAIYLIVGRGPEEEGLRKLVGELRMEDNVVFAGYVPNEELALYYNVSDVFIMPSREIEEVGDFEGFGIVFLEANACGKPVIGGRSGGAQEAILDGETGLLVDPLSVKDIADALIRLLSDEDLAGRLGEKGRKRVERELNWRKVTERILKVMKL